MKKPKDVNLSFEIENDNNLGRVELTPSGELRFYDLNALPGSPPPFKRTISHERKEKRPKIRSEASFNARILTLAGLDELAEYDQVIVIDTGQSTVPWKERVAFSCAVRLKFVAGPAGVEVIALEDKCWLYEFRGFSGNPERLAILTLLHDLASAGLSDGGCIVNDSDLGLHAAINSRREPLFGSYALPPGFILQYAGDVGQEGLNRILRFCDSSCTSLRRDVAAGEVAPIPATPHPLLPGVTLRRGYRDGLRIESGLIKRVPFVPGITLEAWAAGPDGEGEMRLPITSMSSEPPDES